MAICLLLALIVLGYSLNIQSPKRGAGFQMEPYRREARVRALTVSAFALLLVMVGFFVAGVPVGNTIEPAAAAQVAPTQQAAESGFGIARATEAPVEQTPVSGAFGQALPQATEEAAAVEEVAISAEDATQPEAPIIIPVEEDNSDTIESPTDVPSPTDIPTETPTPEPTITPSPTTTPTQTPTPTPTLTPTPISEETARVNTSGSTLWMKRSPGGQNVIILQDGDLLILMPGNANHTGLSWQQIKTLDGVTGWVERQYLAFGELGEVKAEP